MSEFFRVQKKDDDTIYEDFQNIVRAQEYILEQGIDESTHVLMKMTERPDKDFDLRLGFKIMKTDKDGHSDGHVLIESIHRENEKHVIASSRER